MSVDWQALWQQLETEDTTRQERALVSRLKERAKQYAIPKQQRTPLEGEALYLLAFSLGQEYYALDVQAVRGVRALERVTRVPGVPAFYRGVMNVRGQIISVFDLRAFLHMGIDGIKPAQEVILVTAGGLTLAVLADHVDDVLTLRKQDIHTVELPYAQGITAQGRVILDLMTIFSDERLIIGGDLR